MSYRLQQEPPVFFKFFEPVEPIIQQIAQQCPPEWNTLTLSFPQFFKNLAYGLAIEIGSLRLLVNDLWTSPQAKELGLTLAGLTTFHESLLPVSPASFSGTLSPGCWSPALGSRFQSLKPWASSAVSMDRSSLP